jgi:predicted unusual protein kinase regulating ubiquinone biosynthesis (AarF/ABC1/UbiB family)
MASAGVLGGAAVAAGAVIGARSVRRKGWQRTVERVRRSRRLAMLGAQRWMRFQWVSRRGDDADVEAFHLRTAEDVVAALGGMKGAVMKLGQLVSVVAVGLPEAYAENLRSLQQDAPPMAYGLVEQVVSSELGRLPHKVFRRFSTEPAAAASIGQVHRAELRDGTPVAVKVQYPGVDVAIQADLDNAQVLYGFARLAAPGLDPAQLVGELRDRMTEELDYHLEAERQEAFRRAYHGHPWVRIPRVHPELSTRRVLTSDWVAGQSFYAVADSSRDRRDRTAEQLFRFWVGSVFGLGMFNGDPHPGNYFFAREPLPGGAERERDVIWFLDFGLVKVFAPEHVAQLGEQIEVLRTGDGDALIDAMVRFGWLREPGLVSAERALAYGTLVFKPLIEPEFTYTREYMAEVVQATFMVDGPFGDVVRQVTLPRDHVILNRIVMGLGALFARLGATAPWAAIFDEQLRGGPPATELGRLAQGWPLRQVEEPVVVVARVSADESA